MFNNIKNNKKLMNVGKILSGTAGGQLISLLALPILTRIYGSSVIGNWALLVSLTAIINSFSDLGLTDKIMIEENEESAFNIYATIKTLNIVIAIVVVGINFFIFNFFNIQNYSKLFLSFLLLINIFLTQQIQVCTVWFNRNKNYNILMKNPLINNVTFSTTSLILGLVGFTKYGYFVGFICGQILTFIYLISKVSSVKKVTLSEKIEVIKTSKRFIYFQMPSYMLVQIKSQLPTILIKTFYGFEILGYYSLAYRMLNLPVTLIAGAIGKVYFQTVAELHKKKADIGNFTLNSLKKASKLSLLPLIIILSFGDIIVQIIFGQNFIVSGNIMRLMIFFGYFLFLSMATSGISTVLQKQQYILISSFFQIVTFSLGLFIGNYFYSSIYVGVFLLSLSYSVIQIIYFSYIFKSMGIRIRLYLIDIFCSLSIVLLASGVIIFLRK